MPGAGTVQVLKSNPLDGIFTLFLAIFLNYFQDRSGPASLCLVFDLLLQPPTEARRGQQNPHAGTERDSSLVWEIYREISPLWGHLWRRGDTGLKPSQLDREAKFWSLQCFKWVECFPVSNSLYSADSYHCIQGNFSCNQEFINEGFFQNFFFHCFKYYIAVFPTSQSTDLPQVGLAIKFLVFTLSDHLYHM